MVWAKTHKYRAQPTVIDGVRFASKKEAKRYGELKLLEKAGAIQHLELQPRFPLRVPTFAGSTAQVGVYVADFRYWDVSDGDWVTEDVKGVRTETYRLKKKMVEAQYGIAVREV